MFVALPWVKWAEVRLTEKGISQLHQVIFRQGFLLNPAHKLLGSVWWVTISGCG